MNALQKWKTAGCLATLLIVLAIPVYHLKTVKTVPSQGIEAALPATFVGTGTCAECHRQEHQRWKGSHHDRAMERAASDTVRGDFNQTEFTHQGFTSRFYRRNNRYYVYTRGPGGQPGEFEITHTFGWYPLQQYLVPFSSGRLQCLPIAWDVPQRRWYHLYPDHAVDPDDWLYWTNAAQNWNGMCAECHSTNLKKNYDPATDSYETTWSDIDVGCEACHGPGSHHVAWARLPAMARPETPNVGLLFQTTGLPSRELVELCAPCHSRRAALGDYTHAEPDLLDSLLPTLLETNLYFADGQILDEVYVYGSFTQSKMYHREVRCSDCHDVHSTGRVLDGNALCLQCHRAAEYDTRDHHFHKRADQPGEPIRNSDGEILFAVGTGAECTGCHMPGRVYMGIDYRPDHSFRIPRPDLSAGLETPNACSRCHADKSAGWADAKLTEWYGPTRRDHYGPVIAAGRRGDPDTGAALRQLAGDRLYPVIVRATAISLLPAYPGPETENLLQMLLADDEALIRRSALNSLPTTDSAERARHMGPLLYDPVKAVRIEAANQLAGPNFDQLTPEQQTVFPQVLAEYETAMRYSADFAANRHNLGNLYTRLNRPEAAVAQYEAAIAIDSRFYPPKVNLAMLYHQMGKTDRAEGLLREVADEHPQAYQVAYSLGLLLVEKQQYQAAVEFIQHAAEGLPRYARVHYNLGLLLQHLQRDAEAEKALLKALALENTHFDYLYALADYYLKRDRLNEAEFFARRMIAEHPQQRVGHDLLLHIDQSTEVE